MRNKKISKLILLISSLGVAHISGAQSSPALQSAESAIQKSGNFLNLYQDLCHSCLEVLGVGTCDTGMAQRTMSNANQAKAKILEAEQSIEAAKNQTAGTNPASTTSLTGSGTQVQDKSSGAGGKMQLCASHGASAKTAAASSKSNLLNKFNIAARSNSDVKSCGDSRMSNFIQSERSAQGELEKLISLCKNDASASERMADSGKTMDNAGDAVDPSQAGNQAGANDPASAQDAGSESLADNPSDSGSAEKADGGNGGAAIGPLLGAVGALGALAGAKLMGEDEEEEEEEEVLPVEEKKDEVIAAAKCPLGTIEISPKVCALPNGGASSSLTPIAATFVPTSGNTLARTLASAQRDIENNCKEKSCTTREKLREDIFKNPLLQ